MNSPLRSYQGVVPTLGEHVYIDAAALVIGNVVLGDDVSVWPGAVIRGDMHSIRVGHRSNVQDNAVLHITHASDYNPGGWPLTIGDDVVVGHSAILHGCTVGDRVLVGIGAIVNDGATIEDEVIVGAGCLVPPGKTLASGFVYVGNPCRRLRPVTDDERRFFTYSPANYVKLKDQYLAERHAAAIADEASNREQ
ncbi:MAG: gamma carbonic anhydrase family protein [Planctomycetota bacterium]